MKENTPRRLAVGIFQAQKLSNDLGELMYRFLTFILTALLLSFGQAQLSDTHTVRIRIPNYVGLKIIDSAGNITNNAGVTFDYAANPVAYQAAVLGTQVLPPTQVSSFDDIQVVWRRNTNWRVQVRATTLVFTGTGPATGFNLADIRVRRGVFSGKTPGPAVGAPTIAVANVLATWSLSTAWQTVVNENGATRGWESLGFNGRDYEIRVQGDETQGQYTTVVTYRLVSP